MTRDQTETDPICGMRVDPATAKHSLERDGRTYFFCCARCKERFATQDVRAPAAKDAEYTCPMHPEVARIGPGDCPKCGMALEPLVASAEESTAELDEMRKRLIVAIVFSVPLFFLGMSDLLPGDPIGHALGHRGPYDGAHVRETRGPQTLRAELLDELGLIVVPYVPGRHRGRPRVLLRLLPEIGDGAEVELGADHGHSDLVAGLSCLRNSVVERLGPLRRHGDVGTFM